MDAASLTDMLHMGGLLHDVHVHDVMDTKGAPFCYQYE